MRIALLPIAAAGLALTGCQGTSKTSPMSSNDAAVALLQTVNSSAQDCWSHKKDSDFRSYRIIPELDTRVGTPRILIVEAKSAQGLPKFVIEASGNPARIATYGPLSREPLGTRMNKDIERWQKGDASCA